MTPKKNRPKWIQMVDIVDTSSASVLRLFRLSGDGRDGRDGDICSFQGHTSTVSVNIILWIHMDTYYGTLMDLPHICYGFIGVHSPKWIFMDHFGPSHAAFIRGKRYPPCSLSAPSTCAGTWGFEGKSTHLSFTGYFCTFHLTSH